MNANRMNLLLSCRLSLALAKPKEMGLERIFEPRLGEDEQHLLRLLVEDAISALNEVARFGVEPKWLPLSLRSNVLINPTREDTSHVDDPVR